MVICTASNNIISKIDKFFCHSLAIFYYILDVFFILVGHGFFSTNGFGGNNVHEWPTLIAGEYGAINFLGKFRLTENKSTTRATQSFMSGSSDNIRKTKRRGVLPSSYQTCDMSHIDHEVRAIIYIKRNKIIELYRLNYFINSFKINNSTICTCSCKNQFRFIISDFVFKVFVIDKAIFVYVVKFNIVKFTAKIN